MMKTLTLISINIMFLFFVIFQGVVCLGEMTKEQALERDLKGDWVVAKDLVFDSKSESEPSLRRLTFETNAVVRWYYEINEKFIEHVGMYRVRYPKNTQLPVVIVKEPDKGSPSSANSIAFIMQDVTIDIDSRFNVESVGKVLKFSHRDRKHYIFTRNTKKDN